MSLGVGNKDRRGQNRRFFLNSEFDIGSFSLWNFLPYFNFALCGLCGDLRWCAIDFSRVYPCIEYIVKALLCLAFLPQQAAHEAVMAG